MHLIIDKILIIIIEEYIVKSLHKFVPISEINPLSFRNIAIIDEALTGGCEDGV